MNYSKKNLMALPSAAIKWLYQCARDEWWYWHQKASMKAGAGSAPTKSTSAFPE